MAYDIAPSISRKMDLPASESGISNFLRYHATPLIGRRPIPPPTSEFQPFWKGPLIAQSCGRFTFSHELASKLFCTNGKSPPGLPLGRTCRFSGSFIKLFPVGKTQGL